jgi:neutral ceramidase
MGHSFAGGTTDGPGHFDFTQGKTSGNVSNPLWAIVGAGVTSRPSREQADCQYPKPVLLNTGYSHKPYEWQPDTVPVQILRVGQFVMLIAPGEFTTMAGRRLRNAVRSKLLFEGVIDNSAYVVIAGPANAYAHYITTPEEYAIQRYEGASTIYGQYTLEAYMDKFTSIIKYLSPSATGSPISDAAPAEQISKALSLRVSDNSMTMSSKMLIKEQRGVVADTAGLGRKFGSVRTDVTESYERGQTAFAVFTAANPRNNLRLEETFLAVDRLVDSSWTPYRSDSHPSTRFHWVRTSTMIGTSTANISWVIEDDTPAGTYRLTYYGDYKSMVGKITPFIGYSSNFTIS